MSRDPLQSLERAIQSECNAVQDYYSRPLTETTQDAERALFAEQD